MIDGQHRLVAFENLYLKNKYPIQQIPCIIWLIKNEEDFLILFDRINARTPINRYKLFNYKINEIIFELTKKMGNVETIWGTRRPQINKNLFVQEMRENNFVHNMEIELIIKKILEINNEIRGLPRTKRCKGISSTIHSHAEKMNFFLGYDKDLSWIQLIK